MFLCKTCLESNFKNFAIPFSKGKCEYCEEVKSCVDIPSKYLIKKDNDYVRMVNAEGEEKKALIGTFAYETYIKQGFREID